jgi:hypothetical protein
MLSNVRVFAELLAAAVVISIGSLGAPKGRS